MRTIASPFHSTLLLVCRPLAVVPRSESRREQSVPATEPAHPADAAGGALRPPTDAHPAAARPAATCPAPAGPPDAGSAGAADAPGPPDHTGSAAGRGAESVRPQPVRPRPVRRTGRRRPHPRRPHPGRVRLRLRPPGAAQLPDLRRHAGHERHGVRAPGLDRVDALPAPAGALLPGLRHGDGPSALPVHPAARLVGLPLTALHADRPAAHPVRLSEDPSTPAARTRHARPAARPRHPAHQARGDLDAAGAPRLGGGLDHGAGPAARRPRRPRRRRRRGRHLGAERRRRRLPAGQQRRGDPEPGRPRGGRGAVQRQEGPVPGARPGRQPGGPRHGLRRLPGRHHLLRAPERRRQLRPLPGPQHAGQRAEQHSGRHLGGGSGAPASV